MIILLYIILAVLTAPIWVGFGILWVIWQLIRDAFAEGSQ